MNNRLGQYPGMKASTKFAQKMRERRKRRKTAGIKPNRRLQDCLSPELIAIMNYHLTGELRYLASIPVNKTGRLK